MKKNHRFKVFHRIHRIERKSYTYTQIHRKCYIFQRFLAVTPRLGLEHDFGVSHIANYAIEIDNFELAAKKIPFSP